MCCVNYRITCLHEIKHIIFHFQEASQEEHPQLILEGEEDEDAYVDTSKEETLSPVQPRKLQ